MKPSRVYISKFPRDICKILEIDADNEYVHFENTINSKIQHDRNNKNDKKYH